MMAWEKPQFRIRPLGPWDKPKTELRRSSGTFKATWSDTIELLQYEVYQLGGSVIAAQIDVAEAAIRRDGMLKADAKVGSPAVKISFESIHGPLSYATDVYEKRWSGDMPGWQANVRAIALGLQALRAVDRYGITRTGEQYRGFTALGSKPAGHDDLTSIDAMLIFGDALQREMTTAEAQDKESINRLYRAAVKATKHPDQGGSTQVFLLLTKARDVLLAAL
jgi:hypothetical protein